jgi:hypothetical protein
MKKVLLFVLVYSALIFAQTNAWSSTQYNTWQEVDKGNTFTVGGYFTMDSTAEMASPAFILPAGCGAFDTYKPTFFLKTYNTNTSVTGYVHLQGVYRAITDTVTLDTLKGIGGGYSTETDTTGNLNLNFKEAPKYRLTMRFTGDVTTGKVFVVFPKPFAIK